MTLTPEGYRSRLIEKELTVALNAAGAVAIEGPRSCGKTWCARHLSESECSLTDPSNGFLNLEMARMDAMNALPGEAPHLIDDWQEAPKIWDAVRYTVDGSEQCGRFVLTGSASADISKIMHSGAGRIITMRMRTMSLFESGESSGEISLQGLFDGQFENVLGESRPFDELARLIIRGGWPGLLKKSETECIATLGEMHYRIAETDVRMIGGVRRDSGKLLETMRALAKSESTVASKSKIASIVRESEDGTVEEETVAEYIRVLEKLFVIENQPAFHPRCGSSVRVAKAPKRHFTDPSLAAAALGIDGESLKKDLKTFGSLFEALCERDLRIYAQTFGGTLCHYRDHSGRRIDAVVEVPGKGWGAFDIRLGGNQTDEAASNLLSIDGFIRNDGKAEPPLFLCVISGTEVFAHRRPDGVYVVPIRMLGP